MKHDGKEDDSPLVYTVPEFCRKHRFGRTHFYTLLKQGLGPRLMRAGGRTLISVEAAAEWRRRMEQDTRGGK